MRHPLSRSLRARAALIATVAVVAGALAFGMPARPAAAVNGFTPNQQLPLPLTAGSLPVRFIVRGLEPSVRVAPDGTVSVASIRGVPGGVDLHRYYAPTDGPANPDGTYPFVYKGRPDGCGVLSSGCDAISVAEGGGDVDLAVNYPGSGVPNLALTSLTLAPGITATHSTDRGDTFSQPNPASALIPVDDRQWMDGFDANKVYLVYHDVATFQIEVQRSADGGATYLDGYGEAIDAATFPVAGGAAGTANLLGAVRVDRSSCPSRGNLYQIFIAPETAVENVSGAPMRSVYVGVSSDVKLGLPVFTFVDHKVWTGPVDSRNENIFPALAVDGRGNLYAVWSNKVGTGPDARYTIRYSWSTDLGTTWATPIVVSGNANPKVFPWIDADADGHVGIVWIEGDRPGDSNDPSVHEPGTGSTAMAGWTKWNVMYAESVNGHASTPAFARRVISDHAIHRGTVSTGGLGGGANRNLGDYFQIAFDPQHRANVAFSDDHDVHPLGPNNGADDPSTRRLIRAYFTRQLDAPAVSTAGTCAGSGTRPPEEDEDHGDGVDEHGNRVSFVDRHDGASGRDDGALLFRGADGLVVRSSNGVAGITRTGGCVSFAGDARVNGALGYRLVFSACPGTAADTYRLDVSGPSFAYSQSGTLPAGTVRLAP